MKRENLSKCFLTVAISSSKQCTEEHISSSQLTAAIVLVLFVADSRPSQECGRSAYLRPSPRLSLRRTEPCGHSLDHKRLSHSSPCVSPRRCYLGQEMRFQSFAFCVRTLNGPWAGGSRPLNASILVQRDKRTVLESERAPRVVWSQLALKIRLARMQAASPFRPLVFSQRPTHNVN
jgi:hypothetical protein